MRSDVWMYRYLRVAAIVLLAFVLAAQLTLHNHSLIPEGGGGPALTCAVCSFGADRASLDAPLAAATLVLLGTLCVASGVPFASAAPVTRTGRAPPRPR